MLAVGGGTVGAFAGLLIGIALSAYVALLDLRKREDGLRARPEYRLSLFGVPVILALVGGLIGAAIAG
jgi:ABC-type antimicrobial peptide transport system permease subunit